MMKRDFHDLASQKESYLAEKADELRAALRTLDPNLIASQSGSSYRVLDSARGEFHIPFLGKLCLLNFPSLEGRFDTGNPLPTIYSALLLYYLATSDGFPLTNQWASFGDLPDGRTYNAAFQGYTGNEISKVFALDLDGFKSACEKSDGELIPLGDAAYRYQILPRVPSLVIYHLGDEDFPSTCKILFDSSATHYMTLDGCAILGSMLAQRIIKTTTLHFIQNK